MACNTRTSDRETSTTSSTATTTTLLPSISYFFLVSNSVGIIYRSYYLGDYSLLSFVSFTYSAFLLLDLCLSNYQRLPPHEKSPQKRFLKFAIWFLYSAIMFGFVHQFAPLFRQRAGGVLIYAVVTLCSASLFYVLVVWDEASWCDECRRVEEMKMLSHYAKIRRFDSILEMV